MSNSIINNLFINFFSISYITNTFAIINMFCAIIGCIYIYVCFFGDESHNVITEFFNWPSGYLLASGIGLLSLYNYCWKFTEQYFNYTNYVYFLFTTHLYFSAFVKLYYYLIENDNDVKKYMAGKPLDGSEMAALYNIPLKKRIFGQKRKTDFKCFYCGEPLQILGRFKCRAGHVPPENRYIFDNCHLCNDIHEYIECDSCKKTINLYGGYNKYNQEEIDNRGSKYISRRPPRHIVTKFFFIWIFLFFMSTSWGTYFVYAHEYNFNFTYYIYYIIGLSLIGIIYSIIYHYVVNKMKYVVMENPYL